MRKTLVIALGWGIGLLPVAALAETLKQPLGKNWLALASTTDKDQAIGIARHLSWQLQNVRVVKALNGFYAVVAGPYPAINIVEFAKSSAGKNFTSAPKDMLLSDGSRYVETVWRVPRDDVDLQVYSLSKPAQFSAGAFSLRVSGQKLGVENAYTAVDGKDENGSFHFDIGKDVPEAEQESAEAMASDSFHKVGVVKLLAGSSNPQVVLTQFSGGAHCCTTTSILSRPAGAEAWSLVKADARDGEGYSFEDVDGDGARELVSVDNAFLYAFDSYAGSIAPIQIFKLRDGRLDDVSVERAMHARLVQDLAGMEWEAKLEPDLVKSNGYLAGWVAAKIRLGQGDEAWRVFTHNYDHSSSFGPQICKSGKKLDDCAADDLTQIAIPKALAQFLRDNGYGPLPKAAEVELQ